MEKNLKSFLKSHLPLNLVGNTNLYLKKTILTTLSIGQILLMKDIYDDIVLQLVEDIVFLLLF